MPLKILRKMAHFQPPEPRPVTEWLDQPLQLIKTDSESQSGAPYYTITCISSITTTTTTTTAATTTTTTTTTTTIKYHYLLLLVVVAVVQDQD